MTDSELDRILELQLVIAWAGESETDPPRLGWWRTQMVEEYAGADLMARLLPHTQAWAVLEVARQAATEVDAAARARVDDPDHLVTLFRLGFTADEPLGERLRDLKLRGRSLEDWSPDLSGLVSGGWSRERLQGFLEERGASESPRTTDTVAGRRLPGAPGEDVVEAARRLAAAHLPPAGKYPLPHFRIAR